MLASPRVTNILLIAVLAAVGVCVLQLASGAWAGPLDPPAAPGSTDGVREPGTPISSLPFAITTPGRYYLTRNLTGASGQSGVTISADDVTLDLGGFTLAGVAGSIDGVLVSGTRKNIVITGGTIRGWFNGIDAHSASYGRITGTTVMENSTALGDGGYGILLGDRGLIEDCEINANKNHGALTGDFGTVRGCRVMSNKGDGVYVGAASLVESNVFRDNGSSDAYADLVLAYQDTVRGNSFAYAGYSDAGAYDIRIATSESPHWNNIFDNDFSLCGYVTGIAPSGSSDFVPRDGSEHSNTARSIVVPPGYC